MKTGSLVKYISVSFLICLIPLSCFMGGITILRLYCETVGTITLDHFSLQILVMEVVATGLTLSLIVLEIIAALQVYKVGSCSVPLIGKLAKRILT